MQTVGERIRQLRESRGLTRVQMAALIGVSKGLVSMWEAGNKKPSMKTSVKICNNFNVSLDHLWGSGCVNQSSITLQKQ